MITIGIFTTTRAEFGLFKPLIETIIKSHDFDYKLFVGGAHLTTEHGHTVDEITKFNFKIADKFDYLEEINTPKNIVLSLAKATKILASIFNENNFDYVCVLGDRYELLSIAQTAIIFRKPIIHIHGGATTSGVIDEQIRHMITKASHIHFVSCKEYENNIKQMGEEPWRIFNTGAMAVENMNKIQKLSKQELFNIIGLNLSLKTTILTYHPETLDIKANPKTQINIILSALDEFDGQILITAPNADAKGDIILKAIKQRVDNNKFFFIESLGVNKYINLLPNVDFVIGNSSSGVIEAPYFKVPTINIGKRQDGRIRHESVVDVVCEKDKIINTINLVLSKDFISSLKDMTFKFGDGHASENMLDALRNLKNNENLMTKKFNIK